MYNHAADEKLLRSCNSIFLNSQSIRIDGKAFHTYTKGLQIPFDKDFIEDMNFCNKCNMITVNRIQQPIIDIYDSNNEYVGTIKNECELLDFRKQIRTASADGYVGHLFSFPADFNENRITIKFDNLGNYIMIDNFFGMLDTCTIYDRNGFIEGAKTTFDILKWCIYKEINICDHRLDELIELYNANNK